MRLRCAYARPVRCDRYEWVGCICDTRNRAITSCASSGIRLSFQPSPPQNSRNDPSLTCLGQRTCSSLPSTIVVCTVINICELAQVTNTWRVSKLWLGYSAALRASPSSKSCSNRSGRTARNQSGSISSDVKAWADIVYHNYTSLGISLQCESSVSCM